LLIVAPGKALQAILSGAHCAFGSKQPVAQFPMRVWKSDLNPRFTIRFHHNALVYCRFATGRENRWHLETRERERSHGQNCKTQGCKVDAEARDAETRDAQEPSARPTAPRRVGQASRHTQGARGGASSLINRIGAYLRPEAPNGCVRPKRLRPPRCANKRNSAARILRLPPCCKTPENAAKMCACSNTFTAKLKIIARFLNVTVNKSFDIVQGFHVRTDSNFREL
jgi:hypothetical protein